ncbi:DUF2809 domain-containing protein [Actinoplanes sp. CA-142083]|uniref:ribosomal maturation YjgA family protein n=1 Tax=Actinoplanes sp. CA-142083 TaxID=3239903 RepID=UPI003D8AD8E7
MRSSFSRLVGVAMVVVSLGAALGIRALTGSTLETTGALEQISGTALYASAFYGGLLFLWPRATPTVLAGGSLAFCWIVEFLQLTDVPARLSEQSVAARLVLGESFDPADLVWYVLGVALAAGVHQAARFGAGRRSRALASGHAGDSRAGSRPGRPE